jgi:hypothetical protein
MSINPDDNVLIEKYLLGQLSDTEIEDFNCRVNCDHEFARKFRLIKTFPEMMSEAGRIEMDRKLNEAVEQVLARKASHKTIKKWLLGISAVVIALGIILIIIFPVLNQSGKAPKEEEISVKTSQEKVIAPKVAAVKKDIPAPVPQPVTQVVKEVQSSASPVPTLKITGAVFPSGGAICSRKETIDFKWTQKCDTFTRLCIYSETNGKLMLWRGVTPGLQEYKIPGDYLLPGKFYWYVRSKEDKHSFTVVE